MTVFRLNCLSAVRKVHMMKVRMISCLEFDVQMYDTFIIIHPGADGTGIACGLLPEKSRMQG